jgi:hypothetical protein
VRFLGVTGVVSLVLGVPLLALGMQTSSDFVLNLTPVLVASVPAWSMIVGAVGAPIERKLRFVVGLLVFVLVFDVVAFATGWQQLATGASVISNVQGGALVAVYQLMLVSGPVVALVLFAGKRPSMFWEAAGE